MAADDLGIRVLTPYETRGASGALIRCEAWLPDFGSPAGAVVLSYSHTEGLMPELEGHWYSVLYDSYEIYDRRHVIETLDDWQWFAAGPPPDWYTGAPWC